MDEGIQKPETKIWTRASKIIPEMVGLTIEVQDEVRSTPVYISRGMVGHVLGDFADSSAMRPTSELDRIAKARLRTLHKHLLAFEARNRKASGRGAKRKFFRGVI